MTLVKIVETMHNTKNSFLKMLKFYLKLRNELIEFLIIKSIIILKMETKNMLKNELGKKLAKFYLLIGNKICYTMLLALFFLKNKFK